MGVRQYELGLKHAKAGLKRLNHRNGQRQYDSKSAQRSYDNGYSEGYKLRAESK